MRRRAHCIRPREQAVRSLQRIRREHSFRCPRVLVRMSQFTPKQFWNARREIELAMHRAVLLRPAAPLQRSGASSQRHSQIPRTRVLART